MVAEMHLKMRASRDHRAVEQTSAAAAATGSSSTRPMRTTTCEVHAGKLLDLYDRQLRKAICAFCVVQPEHKGHDFVPLHAMVEQAQAEMEACVVQAKEALQAVLESKAEQQSALQALDVAAAAAEMELCAAGEQVCCWVGSGGQHSGRRVREEADSAFVRTCGADDGVGGGAGNGAVREAAAWPQGGGD